MARVLLVEDEITVLILAESGVQGVGHSTYSAGSVVQALALLDDPGEIDLLFTDNRPSFNGYQGARRRLRRLRACRAGAREKPESEGALHHIMKVMLVAGGEMLPKPYTAPSGDRTLTSGLVSNA